MKSYFIGALFGSLSVALWNLLLVLVDYFDLIEFNFHEDKGMMLVVVLIIPLVLLFLLLKGIKKLNTFTIAFLLAFTIVSLIFIIVGN